MKQQLGIAPIYIVLIVAAFVIGGYFIYSNFSNNQSKVVSNISPSPASTRESTNSAVTSALKTYTDDKLGYSFQYPAEWQVSEGYDKNYDGSSSISFLLDIHSRVGLAKTLSIYTLKNTDNLSAANFAKQMPKDTDHGYINVVMLKDQPSYFQSLDAVVAEGFPGGGATGPSALINDNKGHIILLYDTNTLDPATRDQIFSSFKFQ